MIKNRTRLIPRYNWDYGIREFIRATLASFNSSNHREDTIEKIFGQNPILTNSGRTSLYAILKSLDLPLNAGVGVPLFCCPVVFDVIKKAGFDPIFLDINLDDFNLSTSDLIKKRSSLSALIVVHMFGHPVDIDSIRNIAGKIPIIEDCAQSLFSKYKGKYTGFLTNASFFSFRIGKYISAGEGSAIFCKNPILRERINRFVEDLKKPNLFQELIHCTSTAVKSALYKRPWYGLIGYPIGRQLDKKLNLTAKSGLRLRGIAKCNLKIICDRFENFTTRIQRQRNNAQYFINNIKLKKIFLPYEKQECMSNYYQFAIRFNSQVDRDKMANYLLKNGIDSPKYLNEVIDIVKEQYEYKGDCLNSEKASKTVLVIPNYYTLLSHDVEYITKTINDSIQS